MSHAPNPNQPWNTGALAWMARNSVAANLLMLVFIVGGLMLAPRIKQEVFPEVELDTVSIQVVYPGAGPEEVEQGVILAVEEAVRGIDGVKKVRSTAIESMGTVRVELLTGTNSNEVLNDIKSAVDRITSIPRDAERPVISLLSNRQQVISLVIYGDKTEAELKSLGDEIRDELLGDKRITSVELGGVRPPEISIEVPQENMRRYNLTLGQVAAAVSSASVEVPGGGVKTDGGEVLLRTTERRELGHEFEDITVLAQPDGTRVRVGDVARVVDGFQEVDRYATFNGKPAVRVDVFRIGDQTPTSVAGAVREYIERKTPELPNGISLATWNDQSEIFADRIDLLMRNAISGAILVLLTLALFLEIRLALWVTSGLVISVLGGMLFMPVMGVSINMISLFGFILTLGIVVDDAIVAGEAIYHHRQEGMSRLESSVRGIQEVSGPIVFSVLTTVMAFVPLLFVPGMMGKFFKNIPMIVIPILMISLVEAMYILPAHLAHTKSSTGKGPLGFLHNQQQRFSNAFERFTQGTFRRFVEAVFRFRYLMLALGLAFLFATFGVIAGGRIKFTFMPKVEGDVITANIQMPFGTPVADTERVAEAVLNGARASLEKFGGEAQLSRGIYTDIGANRSGGGSSGASTTGGGHLAYVQVFLTPAGERELTTSQFANTWREIVGEVPGVESLQFQFNIGPSSGQPVQLELSHRDPTTLEHAASRLAETLSTYAGVFDVDDGYSPGKDQLDLRLRPEARALGLTEAELARQVRGAFYGAEVARQQRGRDELRIFVRRPLDERTSEADIENMLIRTPAGGEIPLSQAAEVIRGESYTSIARIDGKRVLTVSSDLDETVTSTAEVVQSLMTSVLPDLALDIPGLTFGPAGQEQDRAESLGGLRVGFGFALFAMFTLMAMAFRSYFQPLVVMMAIPFGFVGAVAGHLLLGFDLSMISMMGIVALSGVVVNDSIVLVDAVNTYRREGMHVWDAVVAAATRRFRPILLTSLTTFLGLAPMIAETSPQARFLVPMAVSLGFGVLFTTVIALLIVPCLYLLLEDIRGLFGLGESPPPPDEAEMAE